VFDLVHLHYVINWARRFLSIEGVTSFPCHFVSCPHRYEYGRYFLASTYRPPPTTTAQDHFEYLRDERESLDTTHFMKKNQLTEYLRVAIRTKVNLKATGH
jgi:hypothetical protein